MTFAIKITRTKYFQLFQLIFSKYFDLFAVIFLLRLDSLVSKSFFVMKLACASLALKNISSQIIKLWRSEIFAMIMFSKFLCNLTNFCVKVCFYD